MVAVGVVVAALVPFGGPAWAHSRLQRTDPADGATVTTQRAEVTLTFNERVHGDFTTVVVTGPGGVSYSEGRVDVVDDVVHQRVWPLRSGVYTVAWRAISADGHPVEGRFGFTVALSAALEPSGGPPPSIRPVATTSHGGGGDGWLWVAVSFVVVLAAGGGVWARRRSSGGAG